MTAPPPPKARAMGLKEGGGGMGGGAGGPCIPGAGGIGGGTTTGGMTKLPQPWLGSCPCIVTRRIAEGLLRLLLGGCCCSEGVPRNAGAAPCALAPLPTPSASASSTVAVVNVVDSGPHEAALGRRFRRAGIEPI